MANINLNPLAHTTCELSHNESSEILGGNALETIKKVTTIAGGIANIGSGILSLAPILFPPKKTQSKAPNSVPNNNAIITALAVQDFFS